MHVAKFGSPEAKHAFIPKIIDDSCELALAMPKPGTGSDVAGIKTRAARDGDDYVTNGQKIRIACAHVADITVLACKTDLDAAPPRHQHHAG